MGPHLRGDDGDGVVMRARQSRDPRGRDLRLDFLIHMSNSHGNAFPRRRAR
jgi:hypothetical protein